MKKILLFATVLLSAASIQTNAQTRYLDEVFSSVTVTSNVIYGSNYSVLTGSPQLESLVMDVYEPAGDVATDRPLIIYLPTGSFLPKYFNQLPTGAKTDSATVEMCTRLAKQGYVVAAVEYRKGWNPQALDQETRTQTIIQAVYRGLQDAKTCVRYFRKDVATNSNQYGIDDTRICVGGQGSGGYISLAYATLNKLTEIQMVKFYNGTAGAFMVDTTIMGDFSGLGGNSSVNNPNHAGYSDDILMVFNIGGALGDSTWLEDGEMPIVSIQGVADAFAPYDYGIVTVPGTGGFVVDVSGSSDVSRIGNAFGNNDVFKSPAITDVYTTAANNYNTALDGTYGNGGDEGLFPIVGAGNGNGPWEWWDDATVTAEVNGINSALGTSLDPNAILSNGYSANPVYQGMGPTAGRGRALAYCDTIQGYLAPRLYRGLIEKPFSINETENIIVNIFPNPSTGNITMVSELNNPISEVIFYTLEGKQIRKEINIFSSSISINNLNFPKGIYFVEVTFKKGIVTKKIVIE